MHRSSLLLVRELPVPQIEWRVVGLSDTLRGAIRAREVVGSQLSVVRREMRDGALVGHAREAFSLLSVIMCVRHANHRRSSS